MIFNLIPDIYYIFQTHVNIKKSVLFNYYQMTAAVRTCFCAETWGWLTHKFNIKKEPRKISRGFAWKLNFWRILLSVTIPTNHV